MKKYVVLISLIIITLILAGNYEKWIAYYHLPKESALTESQVIKNVNIIARKYTNKNAECNITSDLNYLISAQELTEYGEDNNISPRKLENGKKIIFLQGDESGFNKNLNPTQVYGMFDCLLFLRKNTIPFELYGICWVYTAGGMDNCYSQKTIITKSEFDELYNSTNITGLTEQQAAKALGDKWIEQSGYVKK